ncbi:OpgC family protein [Beggiatoa leptomitoformis]|uniref:OpgC domain-containing protein n=1 Tax=Beggiatoa leptomitoformis TaxID=288004 RepID=A0A2N9YF60_9GAMM|nr:OpgC domain-containing protein [Beggiatoa leptomitoformis]ALG68533.1 OpgC domain-containing protein [Beggiatoa leptomitoformis]AUI69124.1 OpgC domain-containing protein [Beggiatoa leptomitoformis]
MSLISTSSPHSTITQRELKLDFFRGLALCIIFVAHIPDNWLANYTHGRFGFSDSAELFIFVSGYTAARAFGRTFSQLGFWVGTVRVLHRCWQLYIAHLALFFLLAAICAAGNKLQYIDYIGRLNIYFFFEHTPEAIVGLFSLSYVPNYFDILPMYIAILASVPLIMLLARVRPVLVPIACLGIYLGMWWFNLALPAEIDSDRPWFFNPFGWQLLFFTGFMLGAGWIKSPHLTSVLAFVCLLFILLSIPLSNYPIYSQSEWLNQLRTNIDPLVIKTNFGILRWIHFLALTGLTLYLLKYWKNFFYTLFAQCLIKIGQQGLALFLCSMILSYLAGMLMDYTGRHIIDTVVINGIGIGGLIGIAYMVAWFKTVPWKNKAVMCFG